MTNTYPTSAATDGSPTWLIVGLVLAGGSIGCLAQVPQVRDAARWAGRNADHIATALVGIGGLVRVSHRTTSSPVAAFERANGE